MHSYKAPDPRKDSLDLARRRRTTYAQINPGLSRVDQVTAMSPKASLPLLPVLSPIIQVRYAFRFAADQSNT